MTEIDLKNITARRKGHRSYATKIMNEASQLVEENTPDNRIRMIAITKLLAERCETIEEFDNKILSALTDDAEIEKEVLIGGDYRMRMQESLVVLSEAIEKLSVVEREDTASVKSKFNSDNAKLPKLHLKSFSGDILHFPEFWESFHSAVHNSSLDTITKFNYLRSLLEGAAAATISGLSLNSENYTEALTLLKSRYGKKQVLISAHIDKLMNLPVIYSSQEIKKLREVYDCIEVNVRGLKSLDIVSEHYGPILVSIVMSKLPNEIRLLVSRSMNTKTSEAMNKEWKIDEVIRFLKQEIESREMCKFVSNSSAEGKYKKNEFQEYTAASLVTGTGKMTPTRDDMAVGCTYCRKNHSSSRCDIVTDVGARKSILRRKGRCFICIKTGHIARFCQTTYRCVKCKGRHHVSICEQPMRKYENDYRTDQRDDTKLKRVLTNVVSNDKDTTFLQTAKAVVTDIDGQFSKRVRVLFDGCSQKSFITERVRESLNLRSIRKENMIVRGFGSITEVLKKFDIVRVKVWNLSRTKFRDLDLYVVPFICSPICDQHIELAQATYEHLIGLKLGDSSNGEVELKIDLLIGADFYWEFVTNKMVTGDVGPVALETLLGWVLSGNMKSNSRSSTNYAQTHVMTVAAEIDERLEDLVQKFWNIDSIGVSNDVDNDPVKSFKENVTFDGSHYTVCLPWKADIGTLSDNFLLCKGRLNSLIKRLKKDPHLLEQYDKIIKEQEKEGIVEAVEDNIYEVGAVHYIPHREVIRKERDTAKLRIVYDASAKMKNKPSLNDCLQVGPYMLPKIFDIMVRFRCFKYALTSDIKSAFLNIRIKKEERDYLRFLWISDIHEDNPKIVVKRFTSVIFGVNSSPFLLNATIVTHMEKFVKYQDVVNTFLRDLYVDDSVTGAQSLTEAFELYLISKKLMKEGGFVLKKWTTNNDELRKKIHTAEKEIFGEEDEKIEIDKVLGTNWCVSNDKLFFSGEDVVNDALSYKGVITKRYILKVVSSLYDPLGVLAPIIIRFELTFQAVCQLKCKWDDEIDDGVVRKKWKKLLNDALKLKRIYIPRNYIYGRELADVSKMELHGFADASGRAYAAVIYLRVLFRDGNIMNRFVAAKTRVAPIKVMTIPRLELMACLILSRLIKTISEALVVFKLDRIFCWSDSVDCICWINTKHKVWKRFVQKSE